MKDKSWIWRGLIVGSVLAALVVLYRIGYRPVEVEPVKVERLGDPQRTNANLPRGYDQRVNTNAVPLEDLAVPIAVDDQVQRAVDYFKWFTRVMPVYTAPRGEVNTFVNYTTNFNGKVVVTVSLRCESHAMDFMNGHFLMFADLINGHDTRQTDEGLKTWSDWAEWNEQDAKDLTVQLLVDQGYDPTPIVSSTFTPETTQINVDGQPQTVTPLYSVRLLDAKEHKRVIAYYRVTQERIGLVRWSTTLYKE